MKFLKYLIVWVSENLSVPFWIIGHIHLTLNVYEDIYEVIASLGMNIIVAMAFWMEWREHKKSKSIDKV